MANIRSKEAEGAVLIIHVDFYNIFYWSTSFGMDVYRLHSKFQKLPWVIV